jgi:hypothetical protein
MDALTHSPCSLLLLGAILLAVLVDGVLRRGRGVPPLWWRPVARAFAGAGVFFVLTVCLLVIWVKAGVWKWVPSTLLDSPGSNYITGQRIRYFVTYAAVLSAIPGVWRPGRSSSGVGSLPARRSTTNGLLFGLAIALSVPWAMLNDLVPNILHALGFGGWVGYGGITCFYVFPGEVAVAGLDLFAAVTLLLWLFQCLWGRAVRCQLDPQAPGFDPEVHRKVSDG